MYNCGPTVYSYVHIGNLRSYIFADTLRRALEWDGFHLRQVINITDVGHLSDDADQGRDKVEEGAKREGKRADEITTRYASAFLADLTALNIETDGVDFPKATKHINEQIELIKKLEEKGFTYTTSDGVYFETSKFPRYGALGGVSGAELKEGARVAINREKRNPSDFALWKFSPVGEKRQQEWQSPWGVGFPGWHIECSAMSMKYLGETIDIHTGGMDHIPIHHNNEIAQSEAATDKTFVHYWLHNAFMNINGQKIAKSVGNTFTLEDLRQKGIQPAAFRFWVLLAHYRTPINFTFEALAGAKEALKRLVGIFAELETEDNAQADPSYRERLSVAIDDDLDTPKAVALLQELSKDNSIASAVKRATFLSFDKILGLGFSSLAKELNAEKVSLEALPADILALVKEREFARAEKNWEQADEIREKIEKQSFVIVDSPTGPEIYKRKD